MIVRLLLSLWLLSLPTVLAGQVATVEPDSVDEPEFDAGDVRGRGRSAQAAFERTRLRHAPLRFGSSVGECDEYVGRFCTTYEEGEWYQVR